MPEYWFIVFKRILVILITLEYEEDIEILPRVALIGRAYFKECITFEEYNDEVQLTLLNINTRINIYNLNSLILANF